MNADEYQCALCHRVFPRTRTDDEAMAECRAIEGQSVQQGECELVCDDCWKGLDLENNPHLVEQAAANRLRKRPSS